VSEDDFRCEPERAIPIMKAEFKAKRVVSKVIPRGIAIEG
jgi:hypothetical protein